MLVLGIFNFRGIMSCMWRPTIFQECGAACMWFYCISLPRPPFGFLPLSRSFHWTTPTVTWSLLANTGRWILPSFNEPGSGGKQLCQVITFVKRIINQLQKSQIKPTVECDSHYNSHSVVNRSYVLCNLFPSQIKQNTLCNTQRKNDVLLFALKWCLIIRHFGSLVHSGFLRQIHNHALNH